MKNKAVQIFSVLKYCLGLTYSQCNYSHHSHKAVFIFLNQALFFLFTFFWILIKKSDQSDRRIW